MEIAELLEIALNFISWLSKKLGQEAHSEAKYLRTKLRKKFWGGKTR